VSLNTAAVFNALQSHLLATGLFKKVNTSEPKSAPKEDITAALWMDRAEPFAPASGLQATSAVVTYMIRIYSNMLTEPQDAIDPAVLTATDTVMTALSADFQLGSNARNIDLLGNSGTSLSAQAGYVNIDQTIFRVMDITVPVIINDAWTQTA